MHLPVCQLIASDGSDREYDCPTELEKLRTFRLIDGVVLSNQAFIMQNDKWQPEPQWLL